MISFNILSLFPSLIENYFNDSILQKAISKKLIKINIYNLRDYALNKHKQVDDTPYGGGAGMLLKADVLSNAILKIKENEPVDKIIYLSPQGVKLNNVLAREFVKKTDISYLLVCGRYQGVDQRFIDLFVDLELSIGDYVLSGGELPACVFIEAISRFIPNVIGNEESPNNDSFENNLLKYPEYTRPYEFNGVKVPDVLLSGDHEKIKIWRKSQALKHTKSKRKDIL